MAKEEQLTRLKQFLYKATETAEPITQLGWQDKGFFSFGNGIFDGDILIVKSNPGTVGSGDIVVAEENGREILKQAKDAIISGTPSDAPNVKGVVVGLQRRIART